MTVTPSERRPPRPATQTLTAARERTNISSAPVDMSRARYTPMFDYRTPLQQRANLPAVRRPEGGVVWVGTFGTPTTGGTGIPRDVFEEKSDAKLRFSSLPNDEYNRLMQSMDRWYGPGRWQQSWIRGFWGQAVDHAEYRLRSEGVRISPSDAFDELLARAAERGELRGTGGSGGRRGPTTFVDRQEIVDLTSPSGARAFLETAMEDFLGRRPEKDEYNRFMNALSKQERQAPQIAETRRTVSDSGSTQTSSTTGTRSGGFTPQQFAREFARAQEGAAETSVSTTGINAFLELLGS